MLVITNILSKFLCRVLEENKSAPKYDCYCHMFISHIYACDLISCVLKFVQKMSQRTLLEVHFSVACK